MTRKLYAWESDGKFYLSAFAKDHVNGMRPAREFMNKDDLMAEVNRRGCTVEWTDGK